MKCQALFRGIFNVYQCTGQPIWRVQGEPYCDIHAKLSDSKVQEHGRVPIEQAKEWATK